MCIPSEILGRFSFLFGQFTSIINFEWVSEWSRPQRRGQRQNKIKELTIVRAFLAAVSLRCLSSNMIRLWAHQPHSVTFFFRFAFALIIFVFFSVFCFLLSHFTSTSVKSVTNFDRVVGTSFKVRIFFQIKSYWLIHWVKKRQTRRT